MTSTEGISASYRYAKISAGENTKSANLPIERTSTVTIRPNSAPIVAIKSIGKIALPRTFIKEALPSHQDESDLL